MSAMLDLLACLLAYLLASAWLKARPGQTAVHGRPCQDSPRGPVWRQWVLPAAGLAGLCWLMGTRVGALMGAVPEAGAHPRTMAAGAPYIEVVLVPLVTPALWLALVPRRGWHGMRAPAQLRAQALTWVAAALAVSTLWCFSPLGSFTQWLGIMFATWVLWHGAWPTVARFVAQPKASPAWDGIGPPHTAGWSLALKRIGLSLMVMGAAMPHRDEPGRTHEVRIARHAGAQEDLQALGDGTHRRLPHGPGSSEVPAPSHFVWAALPAAEWRLRSQPCVAQWSATGAPRWLAGPATPPGQQPLRACVAGSKAGHAGDQT